MKSKRFVLASAMTLFLSLGHIMADEPQVVGTLTPENNTFETQVNFAQPTVVRFDMDAVATAISSGYNSSHISVGGRCKYSIDGVDADGRDEFWLSLYADAYAYNSITNTDYCSSEGVMYVPAGSHTISWEWEVENHWSYGNATARIDIANYSEDPLARKRSRYTIGAKPPLKTKFGFQTTWNICTASSLTRLMQIRPTTRCV